MRRPRGRGRGYGRILQAALLALAPKQVAPSCLRLRSAILQRHQTDTSKDPLLVDKHSKAPRTLDRMRAVTGRPECNVCVRGGCFRAARDARWERDGERHTSFTGVLVNGKGRLVSGIWTGFDESIPHLSQGTRLGCVRVSVSKHGTDGARRESKTADSPLYPAGLSPAANNCFCFALWQTFAQSPSRHVQ